MPGFPAKHYPSKTCINPVCEVVFNRRRWSNGQLEPSTSYAKRKYCSRECREQDMGPRGPITATRRQRELIEDVGWILGTDGIVSVANRVGYKSPLHLERTLYKAGAYELAGRVSDEYRHYLDAALEA